MLELRDGSVIVPVFRLALLFGCSAWAVAIALVWLQLGWVAGLAAAVAGPVGGIALTLEPAPEGEPQERAPRAGLGWREITGRARAARGGDDD